MRGKILWKCAVSVPGILLLQMIMFYAKEIESEIGTYRKYGGYDTTENQYDVPPQFIDHGVASPYAHPRGIVATEDGDGNKVLLVWLFDHRGTFGLLSVNVSSGQTQQFDMPFNVGGDAVYASILASNGKLYTLFNSHFVEFDPQSHSFSFQHQSTPRMAMSMTEDDSGKIWAVTYPNSGVVSYDPLSGDFQDYGSVNQENWAQYPRHIAVDKKGWVYVGLGNTHRQIVAFHPPSDQRILILDEEHRGHGMAYVYRNKNGKVYGQSIQSETENWFELFDGQVKSIGHNHQPVKEKYITGTQSLAHLQFTDGSKVRKVDLIDRSLLYVPKDGEVRKVKFDYETEGSWVLNVVASPDGEYVVGGSSFPFRLFKYDFANDQWERTRAMGQFNAFATSDSHIFFGSYPKGHLLKWDYVDQGGTLTNNPDYSDLLFTAQPTLYRPHRVLVHPNNRIVAMGGTPDYGYTGGSLLLYDLIAGEASVILDQELIPDQSTKSMTTLKNGNILGGTTTAPGTGGEKKAHLAYLYEIDPLGKELKWTDSFLPNVQDYSDLVSREDGLVYGIADFTTFFVFNPYSREIVHQQHFGRELGRAVASQSPQIFVQGEEDVFVLLQKGIYRINENTFELELVQYTPQPITTGGACVKGRIFYISGSHLFSYGPV